MKCSRMFALALRLAKFEMGYMDHFVDLTAKASREEVKTLDRLASQANKVPDDWFADDFAEVTEFRTLSSEFAIVGLWRCIELYRKSAVRFACGVDVAKNTYKQEKFTNALSGLGIVEKDIRCARAVDELRCLNNAVKHERRVDNKLAGFQRWRNKKGGKLGSLEIHYKRLRPLAEHYLEDLAHRLIRWRDANPTSPTV